jgi:hypothetical protein
MAKWRSETSGPRLRPSWLSRLPERTLHLGWLGLLRLDLVVIPRRSRGSIKDRWQSGSRAIGDEHAVDGLGISKIRFRRSKVMIVVLILEE